MDFVQGFMNQVLGVVPFSKYEGAQSCRKGKAFKGKMRMF